MLRDRTEISTDPQRLQRGPTDGACAAESPERESVTSSLRKLFRLFSPTAKRNSVILLVLMIIGALLEVLGVAAIPAFMIAIMEPAQFADIPVLGEVIARFGAIDRSDLVILAAGILILVFGFKTAFLVFNYYCQARFITNRRIDLGRRLTHAYIAAPYPFHLARNTAEMLRNIDREVNIIAYQVIAAALEICTRALILAAVLTFLFVVEPVITAAWLVVFGLLGTVGVQTVSTRLKKYGIEEQFQRKHFVQALYQGFGSIKEARILNREAFFAGRISDSIRRMALVFSYKLFAGKAVSPVTEFVAVAGLLVLAVSLVLLGRSPESILVTLSLFVVGLVRLKEMISAVMTHLTNLRYNAVSVGPVYSDLRKLESGRFPPPASTRQIAPRRPEREITLRDIWYRYDGAEDFALKGVDLTIPAGAAVGFVGSTGAGKTTLIDILLGLLEPDRGGILVDGVDVRDCPVGAWQTAIGYVPQSIYLLDDTIRRNIALGLEDDEIDESAVNAAVRTAHIEDFVRRQPRGLDTVIGEQGARVSGGERQRIGIARALYHDPRVLVLDEATSSLDNATEKAVIRAVESLKGQRTIVMIAHRLSTVRNCDRLYFLKDGRIEAEGNYAELETCHAGFRLMATG